MAHTHVSSSRTGARCCHACVRASPGNFFVTAKLGSTDPGLCGGLETHHQQKSTRSWARRCHPRATLGLGPKPAHSTTSALAQFQLFGFCFRLKIFAFGLFVPALRVLRFLRLVELCWTQKTHTYARTHVCMYALRIYTYACMYVCTHVRAYLSISGVFVHM